MLAKRPVIFEQNKFVVEVMEKVNSDVRGSHVRACFP